MMLKCAKSQKHTAKNMAFDQSFVILRGLMVSAKYSVPFSRFSNVSSFSSCSYTMFTAQCECEVGKLEKL